MQHPESPPPGRPTAVRHAVVAVTALAAVLLYLDRVCIAFAGTYIRQELGLSPVQMGYVLGTFFWAYALGQVPAGWLSDRFGGRRMMTAYVLAWSLFTAATAAATSLAGLIAARFAFGLAQAGAYPTATSLLSRWVPPAGRGRASSMVSLGGRLGGAAAPLVTALLLVWLVPVARSPRLAPRDVVDPLAFCLRLTGPDGPAAAELARRVLHTWPGPAPGPKGASAEVVAEGLNRALQVPTLVDGVPFAPGALPREATALAHKPTAGRAPAEVERLNRLAIEAVFPGMVRALYGDGWRLALALYGAAGLVVAAVFWVVVRDSPARHPWANVAEARLGRAQAGEGAGRPPRPPWRLLVTSGNLWLMSFSEFGVNLGWVFVVTLLPDYLAEQFAVPIEKRGSMAGVPLLFGSVGMLAGGWVTDALTKKAGPRWGRAVPNALSKFAAAAAFLACLWIHSAWGVVAAMAVMAVATDLAVPSVWAFAQDVGGRHAGSALGWTNMWGNFGAALSPVVLAMARQAGGWDVAFLIAATSFLLAGLAAALVDARKPLELTAETAATGD